MIRERGERPSGRRGGEEEGIREEGIERIIASAVSSETEDGERHCQPWNKRSGKVLLTYAVRACVRASVRERWRVKIYSYRVLDYELWR